MAVTYDDFLKLAQDSGLMDSFSQHDLETAKRNPEFGMSLIGFKQDYNNASTEEQKILANEGANALRMQYGSYTGGADGSGYEYSSVPGAKVTETIDAIENRDPFTYSRQDEYDALVDAVVNPEPFNYDPESDPVFGSYKKGYLREGERASANALAQAAAASGGVPSSYAVTAAQQAGNYYAGQLNDMIPVLEQNAYGRYQGDAAQRLSALGVLQSDRAQENSDWLNDQNVLLQLLGIYQNQDQTAYDRIQDEKSWALTEQQMADAQAQQNYENALAMYQLLGYATPEIAATLGIPYEGGGEDTGDVSDALGPGSDTGGGIVEELRGKYGGGVTQEVYDQLVSMYGADVVAAAEIAVKTNEDPEDQLTEEEIVDALYADYPNGVITSIEDYTNAVKLLGGSTAVAAAGLKYGATGTAGKTGSAGGVASILDRLTT